MISDFLFIIQALDILYLTSYIRFSDHFEDIPNLIFLEPLILIIKSLMLEQTYRFVLNLKLAKVFYSKS